MMFLDSTAGGEWWTAWLAMSITFLVAGLGVVGLGWYVIHEDRKNRANEAALEDKKPEH
jgi:hypothetical protein